MANRNEVRRERHRLLRELGYSPEDARRLRDNSFVNIEKTITRTERRLARRPAIDRSPEQQRRLRKIRDYRKRDAIELCGRTESKPTRIANWSDWSRDRSFPREFYQRARKINRDSGRRANASYGFRILYHMYISGESESLSKRRFNRERFERRDT